MTEQRDVVTASRTRWAEGERAWGDHEPEPVLVTLGPWRFELRGDELAELSFDGSTVARSVRAVARDRDWNTVSAEVEVFEHRRDGADLVIAMRGFGADIRAQLEVRADERRFAVRLIATSRTEFASNRLGLVVLHQPELAGAELTVGAPDGDVRRTAFPVEIAPHQPAMDIRSLAWTHDGVAASVGFEGDVFEMEDQRNWTDASYKTYSTPLSRPFPVTIAAGAVIEQSAVFEAERVEPRMPDAAAADGPVLVELVASERRVPEVTLGASTVPEAEWSAHPLPDGVAGVLVELDTRTPTWHPALERARREAGTLPLDVRIIAEHPDEVRSVVEAAASAGPVSRLGVFAARGHVTEVPLWRALTDAASSLIPDAVLVGGARSHFTELNRRHSELPDEVQGVVFALTPQMHATERAQLVESIPIQTAVVGDAARIAAGRPLHVGPITLRSRFNAVATSGSDDDAEPDLAEGYGAHRVVGATDGRQASAALRAWTVASFAAICAAAATAEADVASVDYFESFGPRGIRDSEGRFPVADAIAAIAGLGGRRLLVPASALPDDVHVVGGIEDGAWRALVANLSERATSLTVRRSGRDHEVTVAPYDVVELGSDDD